MILASLGSLNEAALLLVIAAATGLFALAYWVTTPYPIVLVLGGLAMAFVPGMPAIDLPPDLVLVLFLPPLLYGSAFFSSLRDLKDNLRQISALAVGLVILTTLMVGVVAHSCIGGLSWAAAFALGAVVAPTDPVAATAIAGRLGAPRRFVTIIEGESLINDATALIAYKFAIAAVLTGSFSLPHASVSFVLSSLGGVGIGVAVGFLVAKLRKPIHDPPTEITISILTPYLAYLPAAVVGASAVLAAVTAGVYLGFRAPVLVTPSTRLQAYAVWEVLTFILNAALFILLGTQLPRIIAAVSDRYSTLTLVGYGAAISAAVIGARFAWVFGSEYLPRLLKRPSSRPPADPWQQSFLLGFTGMRGAVSLAAALAIPATTQAGNSFPARDVIVLMVYVVILVTLVGQGLLLGPLIGWLQIDDDMDDGRFEADARVKASEAALRRLEELVTEEWVLDDTATRMRRAYEFRIRRFGSRYSDDDDGGAEDRSQAYQRLRHEVLEAERAELIRLRDAGEIPSDVMQRIERDLDLEDVRLDATDS